MRSSPFILDKATGEPKTVPHTYDRVPAWKLIVKATSNGKRKVKLYHSYAEATAKKEELAERLGDRAEVHVVSRQLGYGPPYSKISDRKMLELNENRIWWCPYCRKLRQFLYRPAIEMRACEFCLTWETDWHVQRCNPILWEAGYFKRIFYRGDEE